MKSLQPIINLNLETAFFLLKGCASALDDSSYGPRVSEYIDIKLNNTNKIYAPKHIELICKSYNIHQLREFFNYFFKMTEIRINYRFEYEDIYYLDPNRETRKPPINKNINRSIVLFLEHFLVDDQRYRYEEYLKRIGW